MYFSDNVLPAGESDAVSTTSSALPVRADARVTTHAATDLADATVSRAGTQYPSRDEASLLAEIAAAIR